MNKIITLLFLMISFGAFAQLDTIYTNSNKIPCTVKKITPDAVEYVYPDEEIINSVYKNSIQKIVFKSGRVQIFAELTSYKTVNGSDDYENVTLTQVEGEVKGLFKLGDVSSKAKGTTALSSMVKVKERAYKKAKIVAAMMGANIVYLTQNATTGNQPGGYFQSSNSTETNLSGVAYSNKLPSFDDFNKLIGTKNNLICIKSYKMSQRNPDLDDYNENKKVEIFNIYNESGFIMVKAKIAKVDSDLFRVISFTNDEFTLVWKDGERIYNYVIKL